MGSKQCMVHKISHSQAFRKIILENDLFEIYMKKIRNGIFLTHYPQNLLDYKKYLENQIVCVQTTVHNISHPQAFWEQTV